MGLIKAGMGALGGTLADQWKEFFYCDSLDKDVLMVKGQKRTSRRSSNYGEDNIITNGSGIAVADGQCMLIVEQGKVLPVCVICSRKRRRWHRVLFLLMRSMQSVKAVTAGMAAAMMSVNRP